MTSFGGYATVSTGSIKLGSLFLTLPTRALTGYIVIGRVYGTKSDFNSSGSAGGRRVVREERMMLSPATS